MKKIVIFLAAVIFLSSSLLILNYYIIEDIIKETDKSKKYMDYIISYNNIIDSMNNNKEFNLDDLTQEDKENLNKYIQLKQLIDKYNRAEALFDNALKIAEQAPNTWHKSIKVKSMLIESMDSFKELKDKIDEFFEISDIEYNFQYNFIRGNIYYKYILYFNPQEKNDYFEQVLSSYKKALEYKPHDRNTIINIELLINDPTRQNQEDPDPNKKIKLLNQAGIILRKGN